MGAVGEVVPAPAAPDATAAPAANRRTLELRRGEASPAALAKLQQVARGFESVFTDLMLGKLLAPVFGSGFAGSGAGSSVVQGIIEQNLADALSKGGGFGIGRMVVDAVKPLLATQAVSREELEKTGKKHSNDPGTGAAAAARPARVEGELP
jgi:Rod binding domain-containing protein